MTSSWSSYNPIHIPRHCRSRGYLGMKISLFQLIKTTYAVVSVVSDIAKEEIDGLICAYRVGKVINDVEREKKKLISNRDVVQEKIEAIDKTKKVNDAVFDWLKEMEKLVQEVENLTINTQVTEQPGSFREFRRLRADHAMRYEMYDEMLKKIKALNIKCDIEPFSSPIPGLEHFSSDKKFVCFKPMKEASEQLLEALRDDNCYIVGLYGKRGSGKTKLVKAVGKKAKYSRIFHQVLFLNVSRNPNVRRIQDEIADSLNLKFDRNTTEAGRARKIYSTLESMDSPILVILDDVWAKLYPEDVGIPFNNSNRCKFLLTMCRQQECALMNCQREIPLRPLSKEEAWILFKKHSGIGDESSSDILNVAQEVAFECEGLPGTIKDVGSSLKNKPVEEWKASLDSLRHSMAKYQIFLSFRGEDTRYSFTGSLYRALCQGGFKTFMDDGGLNTGDQISPSLINAIEVSRLSITVLSENYASSSWCLDELVKILECVKLKNQLVWPIFYKVEPSDVRHVRNSYGKAMAEHETKFGNDSERVKKWRSALFEVSNLSGKTYKTGYEYEFIQKIVEDGNNIKNRLYIRSMDME